ncbi:MAG: zf-HC2 domain-containing protein [Candidatus Omnitrophota bacterium]
MDCKKIRDLLSEYIDSELNGRLSVEINQHLSSCDGCRQIHEAILGSSVNILRRSERTKAPEDLWERIKAGLEEKKPNRPFAPLFIQQPAFSLATAVAIIIIAITAIKLPGRETGVVASYMEDQIEFFEYLANGNGLGQEAEMIDLGTAIEKYLL